MKSILPWVAVLGIYLAAGCQKPVEKHYAIVGEVISTDLRGKMMMVKHGDIPGLMPAMTMNYQVAEPKEIQTLQPGDMITADLVVSESKGRLEKIQLVSKGEGKTGPGSMRHVPEKGEKVPNFALVNQDGKKIYLDSYRGKALLVTFIYTRCPLPDFCPRMNENFSEVQKLLKGTEGVEGGATFLSISFDPEHDTPAVLKHYAAIYTKHSAGEKGFDWQFSVPSAKDLPEVAQFFGLEYHPDEAQFVHSLSTTLVGPDGKVVDWYMGNDWSPSEVAQAMTALVHPS